MNSLRKVCSPKFVVFYIYRNSWIPRSVSQYFGDSKNSSAISTSKVSTYLDENKVLWKQKLAKTIFVETYTACFDLKPKQSSHIQAIVEVGCRQVFLQCIQYFTTRGSLVWGHFSSSAPIKIVLSFGIVCCMFRRGAFTQWCGEGRHQRNWQYFTETRAHKRRGMHTRNFIITSLLHVNSHWYGHKDSTESSPLDSCNRRTCREASPRRRILSFQSIDCPFR